MTEETPGHRAHDAWHRERWPGGVEACVAKDWEILSDRAKGAWEKAALSGAEAIREEHDRFRAALEAIAASDGTCGERARKALEGSQ
jgi:hypothetical protein